MDDLQIEKVERTLRLFEQREATYDAHTSEIIHHLSDPVVRVICDVLNVDEENISWEEVEISSPLIALRFKIGYNSKDEIPAVLDIIAPSGSDDNPLTRTITMAFPIIYSGASYEEFHEFIMTTLNNAVRKRKITTDDPELTVDQQLQAFMHRQLRKVSH